MFRMTFFINKHPDQLERLVKPLGFEKRKDSFLWKMDDSFFEILPFANQDRFSAIYGYRVNFNTGLEGTKHLFTLSIGLFEPKVTGLEYDFTLRKSKQSWLSFFCQSKRYQLRDPRGIFTRNEIGLIVVGDNHVNIQMRPNKPKGGINPFQSLRDMNQLIGELDAEVNPVKHDLFSFAN